MENQNLGVVITNATARKIIYGIYVIAVLAALCIQVYMSATYEPEPEWLIGAISVLAFLGAPIGGLAAANTGTKTSSAVGTLTPPVTPALPAVPSVVPDPYMPPTPTNSVPAPPPGGVTVNQ